MIPRNDALIASESEIDDFMYDNHEETTLEEEANKIGFVNEYGVLNQFILDAVQNYIDLSTNEIQDLVIYFDMAKEKILQNNERLNKIIQDFNRVDNKITFLKNQINSLNKISSKNIYKASTMQKLTTAQQDTYLQKITYEKKIKIEENKLATIDALLNKLLELKNVATQLVSTFMANAICVKSETENYMSDSNSDNAWLQREIAAVKAQLFVFEEAVNKMKLYKAIIGYLSRKITPNAITHNSSSSPVSLSTSMPSQLSLATTATSVSAPSPMSREQSTLVKFEGVDILFSTRSLFYAGTDTEMVPIPVVKHEYPVEDTDELEIINRYLA